MSPGPVLPGLFLPCSLPRLLSAAAGGGLEPSPVRRFRGASPHRLLSYAKEPPVAALLLMAHSEDEFQGELQFPHVDSGTRAGNRSKRAGPSDRNPICV